MRCRVSVVKQPVFACQCIQLKIRDDDRSIMIEKLTVDLMNRLPCLLVSSSLEV